MIVNDKKPLVLKYRNTKMTKHETGEEMKQRLIAEANAIPDSVIKEELESVKRWEAMTDEERSEYVKNNSRLHELYEDNVRAFDEKGMIGSVDCSDGPFAVIERMRKKL